MLNSLEILQELLDKTNQRDITVALHKKKRGKEIRETKLLANFHNGYAEGWYMCVPSAFKDALDIKYTDRVIEKIRKAIIDKRKNEKKEIKKKEKEKIKVWTQGTSFSF